MRQNEKTVLFREFCTFYNHHCHLLSIKKNGVFIGEKLKNIILFFKNVCDTATNSPFFVGLGAKNEAKTLLWVWRG